MQFNLIENLILLFFLFLLANISLTFGAAQIRKRKNRVRNRIETVFAEHISAMLYPLPGEKPDLIQTQRAIREAGVKDGKEENIQYAIQLMIRTQQALAGENHEKLKKLYTQIPPYGASIKKVRNKNPFIKARGVKEIYEMDQSQYLKEISKYWDDENIYLRREAQIAMVTFLGWESVRFLPYLTQRISLWQQIKIVEKLQDLCKYPTVKELREGYVSENPDVLELVIRIIKKYQLLSEVDFVFQCLEHPVFEVRNAAIYCLLSFNVNHEFIGQKLLELTPRIPSDMQQRQVVNYLMQSGDMLES